MPSLSFDMLFQVFHSFAYFLDLRCEGFPELMKVTRERNAAIGLNTIGAELGHPHIPRRRAIQDDMNDKAYRVYG